MMISVVMLHMTIVTLPLRLRSLGVASLPTTTALNSLHIRSEILGRRLPTTEAVAGRLPPTLVTSLTGCRPCHPNPHIRVSHPTPPVRTQHAK
eukprot:1270124-Rhodomonas_salina.2